ncbi:MAG: M14 metallopeptidase family protein [Bacteroidales bacterium]
MKCPKLFSAAALLVSVMFFLAPQTEAQVSVPDPVKHFGFIPGSDYNLFTYEELIDYLMKLDKASPMVSIEEIGASPMGRKMYIVFISSEKNIKNLPKLREINRELALNPSLSEGRRKEYIADGKVFFLATLSMHSTEVAPSQAAPLIAYQLVTTTDPLVKKYLDDVVYMMVPNHNPDGMDLVVENYKKYRGTQYEGASLPQVYHKYVGHDNNRDFISLTQEDTKAIARICNLDWFPQVMVEKHQMGSTGIRYYIPPVHDPIAVNIDGELWSWTGVFGTNMLRDLTGAGLTGVGQNTIYDMYWPGSTETCIWKNVIGMLTEAASAREASPIYIEPNELQASGKGLSEYDKSINFPAPWPGGWWRLGDIVRLEIESTLSVIKTSSLHRGDILRFRNDICKREVEKGRSEPPYYYVVPAGQADQSELIRFVNLMREQGVSCYRLTADHTLDGINLKSGDFVYPLAQPFRAFVKEVMENQEFPVRHYSPGGEVIRPYDVTSWSLPLHRGLTSYEITSRDHAFEGKIKLFDEEYAPLQKSYRLPAVFPVTSNGSFMAAFMAAGKGMKVSRLDSEVQIEGKELGKGSFVITGGDATTLGTIAKEACTEPVYAGGAGTLPATEVSIPRIALVETYFSDVDAGWTRYLFDTYSLPYKIIRPGGFADTDLEGEFDIIIFPSSQKNILMTGKPGSDGAAYMSSYHPDYQKGMGKKGFERLLLFLNNGGTIISWGQSTDLFTGLLEMTADSTTAAFTLPFANTADQAKRDGLSIPGSLVRIELKEDHPLTRGMPASAGVFYRGNPLFTTSVPRFDMDRRVIGRFPEKKILLSGYCEREELLGGKPAMIWLRKGKGQIVLYSFNPQFRASTQGAYKLLFNALFLPPAEQQSN